MLQRQVKKVGFDQSNRDSEGDKLDPDAIIYKGMEIIKYNLSDCSNSDSSSNNIVYRIDCTPIEDRWLPLNCPRHCSHSVCAFSSRQRALDYLPNPPSSYDHEDNVKWVYQVVSVESTKELLAILDNPPPSHFPYCGY